ncbi:MAG: hypothetical protein Q9169_002709 [Polycauliona sp. 2 TL-2023]
MAPKRKGKKAASNPARGFATTSVASKTKVPDEESRGSPVPDEQHSKPDLGNESTGDRVEEKELHELSPEELEKQLEESDLQIFVEKHLEKIKRDVSRQVSRLQTEKRLLRPQAEFLSTRSWLPPEIMALVAQTLDAERPLGKSGSGFQDTTNASAMSEDELCIKIWTLKQMLHQLGFPNDQSTESLQNLLKAAQIPSSRESLIGRDNIWGLDFCLDWLALHCETKVMPSEESTNGYGDAHNTGNATTSTEYDTESDSDPETMTERYIALQTQLYTLQPDLQNGAMRGPAKGKAASRTVPTKKTTPQITRLQQKLERLKGDILFDQHEAEQQWAETRNKLAQAAAERKRMYLHNDDRSADGVHQASNNHGEAVSIEQLDWASKDSEEDNGVEALGEFFSGLPESPSGDHTACLTTDADGKESERRPVVLRDFGKWNGVNPRRTFEEACKASIRWSCNQPLPLEPPSGAILCEADERYIRVEMITDAVPDAVQSEAYVSTAALFLIFSAVPKEEKASLRLPPVWKDLWGSLSALKKKNDSAIDREELREIRTLIDSSTANDEDHDQISRPANLDIPGPKQEVPLAEEPQQRDPKGTEDTDAIRSIWTSKSATPSFNNMLRQRKNLPIWGFKEKILQTIRGHQTVIVCGETGCGKSTQVPSFILEHELSCGRACKVYCTEPRRISAISLARRVSEELGERKSDVGTTRSLVGYAIRLESKLVRETRLVYATTGIVMRMLEASDNLHEITHLVLDEVHERSIESDFLLIVLRKLLVRRPTLRVILMSATVDAEKFSNYFEGAPVLTVPGRTFPVQSRYLEDAIEEINFSNRDFLHGVPSIDDDNDVQAQSSEKEKKAAQTRLEGYSQKTRSTLAQMDEYRINYDLIVGLLETIATKSKFLNFSKAILVFLPGIAEIRRVHDMLSGHNAFSKGWYIHALHSTIAMDEQERAFAIPPQGHRKIVLATNIAETGVTIPDVTCVIDTGKHKEMRSVKSGMEKWTMLITFSRFDERRQLSRLIEVFISRANAKQRRGRAGRVQEGICFHLFTKARHDTVMTPDQTPEILRLSLQDLVLRVKICKLGAIEDTLAEALDPPLAKNIRRAIDALVDVKALTASEELTPLGRQLAKLPLDVFLGKVILLGCIFKCLDGAVTIAAILSSKSPFSAPIGARSQADQVRLAFKRGDSDLLTVYNAYCAWRRVCNSSAASEQQFCRKNFLLQQNLANVEELKAQLTTCLVEAKFIALEGGEKSLLNKCVQKLHRENMANTRLRVRSWSSRRSFVEIPARYDSNMSDLVLNSVIGWSFYPKLLKREGKGWRNVANNQSVSLSPTSVNKGAGHAPNWLSFYHIMQSSNKYYNAHETSAMEPLALALACGDAEFKMYSGMIVIDGNRIRFSVDDWKIMLAIKTLRQKLRQVTAQSFRDPGRALSSQQQAWLGIWEKIVEYHEQGKANGEVHGSSS